MMIMNTLFLKIHTIYSPKDWEQLSDVHAHTVLCYMHQIKQMTAFAALSWEYSKTLEIGQPVS